MPNCHTKKSNFYKAPAKLISIRIPDDVLDGRFYKVESDLKENAQEDFFLQRKEALKNIDVKIFDEIESTISKSNIWQSTAEV